MHACMYDAQTDTHSSDDHSTVQQILSHKFRYKKRQDNIQNVAKIKYEKTKQYFKHLL